MFCIKYSINQYSLSKEHVIYRLPPGGSCREATEGERATKMLCIFQVAQAPSTASGPPSSRRKAKKSFAQMKMCMLFNRALFLFYFLKNFAVSLAEAYLTDNGAAVSAWMSGVCLDVEGGVYLSVLTRKESVVSRAEELLAA